MTAKGTLRFKCRDAAARRGLASVLAPDNEGAPRGLNLKMRGTSRSLTFEVSAPTPSSLASTLLAVLRDVSLFQEVWLLSTVKQGRGE